MALLRRVQLDQSIDIPGQKAGSSFLANVEGSVGRDGVSLPFVSRPMRGDEQPEELEALIPWSRIKFVIRAREAKGGGK